MQIIQMMCTSFLRGRHQVNLMLPVMREEEERAKLTAFQLDLATAKE